MEKFKFVGRYFATTLTLLLFLAVVIGCSSSEDDEADKEVNNGTDVDESSNVAPIFISADSVTVTENTSSSFYTAVATDADGDSLYYAVTESTDGDLFVIDDATGELYFSNPPIYSEPQDSDLNNEYVVGLSVKDSEYEVVMTLKVIVAEVEQSSATWFVEFSHGLTYFDILEPGMVDGEVIIIGGEAATEEYTFQYVDEGLQLVDLNSSGGFVIDASYLTIGNAETFSMLVEDQEGNTETISGTVRILEQEVVGEGSINAGGGIVEDESGDVVLVIPENELDQLTDIKIMRAVNSEGGYRYWLEANPELSGDESLELYLPKFELPPSQDNSLLEGDNSNSSVMHPSNLSPTNTARKMSSEGWKQISEYGGYGIAGLGFDASYRRPILSSSGFLYNLFLNNETWSYLFSSCVSTDEECMSSGEPVLFVHGYTLDNDFWPVSAYGGGDSTWGKFREIAKDDGKVVFEFIWRTNARFQDTARDLYQAIQKINALTNKKVNIVSHSFGGLLVRGVLQGLIFTPDTVPSYRYGINNAQTWQASVEGIVNSLTTVGTPHSGILRSGDDANSPYSAALYDRYSAVWVTRDDDSDLGATGGTVERIMPHGKEGILIQTCGQLSCLGAGEETNIPGVGNLEERDIFYDFEDNKGSYPVILAESVWDGEYPDIPTLVLIGITTNDGNGSIYDEGDGLISYNGQRFHPSLSGSECWIDDDDNNYDCVATRTTDSNLSINGNSLPVREKVLYFGTDAIPGGVVAEEFRGGSNNGYAHNGVIRKASGRSGSFTQVNVQDRDHITYKEIVDFWENLSGIGTSIDAPRDSISISGKILVYYDGDWTSDVNATIHVRDSADPVWDGPLGEDGSFSFDTTIYSNHSYYLNVYAGDCSKFYNTEITGSSIASVPDINMGTLRIDCEGDQGTVALAIVDSGTGDSLPSVTYDIYKSNDLLVSSGTTYENGYITLSDRTSGEYYVKLSKSGYRDKVYHFTVVADEDYTLNVPMTIQLAEGTLRAVLGWSQNPRDLDAHLYKYNSSGDLLYHIYYGNKNASNGGDSLDVDKTNSYGPETITVQSVDSNAKYIYYVHDFAGSGSITGTSNASVEINFNGESYSLDTPESNADNDNKAWWKVFEIIDGGLVACTDSCMSN